MRRPMRSIGGLDMMIGPELNPAQVRTLLEWLTSEMPSGATLKIGQAEGGFYFGAVEEGVVLFMATDGTIRDTGDAV